MAAAVDLLCQDSSFSCTHFLTFLSHTWIEGFHYKQHIRFSLPSHLIIEGLRIIYKQQTVFLLPLVFLSFSVFSEENEHVKHTTCVWFQNDIPGSRCYSAKTCTAQCLSSVLLSVSISFVTCTWKVRSQWFVEEQFIVGRYQSFRKKIKEKNCFSFRDSDGPSLSTESLIIQTFY